MVNFEATFLVLFISQEVIRVLMYSLISVITKESDKSNMERLDILRFKSQCCFERG